ncbi:uncharacterized protein LOC106987612 isoform X3 [Acinonyx jubatus]|uniref:Uncharacterized protein LOC106987612 isoform X3 n=1 Tax=Acinonyx jubatus TaxID=32536 RepID=A0ABM3PDZ7_ACIJB|nr:uncharacterized protein LOC106987612 isoform X3 [Acinonyx jubatus]
MQVTKASIFSGPCSYQGTVPEVFLCNTNNVVMCFCVFLGVSKEENLRSVAVRRQKTIAEVAIGAREEGVPKEENMWAVPVRRHQGVAEVATGATEYGVPEEEKMWAVPVRRQQDVAEVAAGATKYGVPVEEKMWAFPVRTHQAVGEFPVVSGTMENDWVLESLSDSGTDDE